MSEYDDDSIVWKSNISSDDEPEFSDSQPEDEDSRGDNHGGEGGGIGNGEGNGSANGEGVNDDASEADGTCLPHAPLRVLTPPLLVSSFT